MGGEKGSLGSVMGVNLGTMVRPLLLSLTTALIPSLVKKITVLERRHDKAVEMRITLIRVFSLKMSAASS